MIWNLDPSSIRQSIFKHNSTRTSNNRGIKALQESYIGLHDQPLVPHPSDIDPVIHIIRHIISKDLCTIACANSQLDICNVRHLPDQTDISKVHASIWRFFPALDPNVDVLVSRDLDSR